MADVSREVTKDQAESIRGGDASGVQTWDSVRVDANKLASTMSVDPNILMGMLHRDALEAPEMSARITTYASS